MNIQPIALDAVTLTSLRDARAAGLCPEEAVKFDGGEAVRFASTTLVCFGDDCVFVDEATFDDAVRRLVISCAEAGPARAGNPKL